MIRPAIPSDAQAIADLVHAAYRHYIVRIGKPPGPMNDDYAARVGEGQVWVAEQPAGTIAGVLVLENLPHNALLLDNIAVAPAAQGTGIGRALMLFAEAEATRRGYHRIRLYTHVRMVENIALYHRAGYVETFRATEKGFDRVYMEKQLG